MSEQNLKVDKTNVRTWRIVGRTRVAEFFGMSTAAVDAWVRRGCPVKGKDDGGRPEFDLLEVAKWKFYTSEFTGVGGEIDPEKLPPRERLDWYKGEATRVKLMEMSGELIKASEMEKTLADMFKTFTGFLETLPDIMERDAGISGEVAHRMQVAIDAARDRLYAQMSK